MSRIEHDIVVVGAGLAGLTATLAFLRLGCSVLNIAPPSNVSDRRTTALLSNSVDYLDELGAGQTLLDHGSPLKTMRIIDATGRLIHAPQVDFHSSEIGLENFGRNIKNGDLIRSLRAIIDEIEPAVFRAAKVEHLVRQGDEAELVLDSGSVVSARLVVGADGSKSAIREASGISVRRWSYPQTAIVLNFEHSLPHDDTSTEFHTRNGPFTTVPLGKGISSLVWVEKPEVANALASRTNEELELEIEKRMYSMLGKIRIASDIQSFPLSGMIANRFGRANTVLIGEAAHVFPPIGAQGFNLGIRDIQALAQMVQRKTAWESIPEKYDHTRRADVASRTASVDLMNRSLLSDFLPVQAVRSIALSALGAIGPLRRMAMREGVSPGSQFEAVSSRIKRGFETPTARST